MHCGPLRLIRNRDLPSKRPRLFENATPWWYWSCLSKASMVVQRIRTTSRNLTFVVWDISCYLWGLVHRYLFHRLNMSPWVHNFLVIPKKKSTQLDKLLSFHYHYFGLITLEKSKISGTTCFFYCAPRRGAAQAAWHGTLPYESWPFRCLSTCCSESWIVPQ
jgi:hypothetical protein